MRLLRPAIEKQRWDLAAYVIVLTIAKLLGKGDKLYDGESRERKKGRPKGQSER
jgi:hypothetical protein